MRNIVIHVPISQVASCPYTLYPYKMNCGWTNTEKQYVVLCSLIEQLSRGQRNDCFNG